MKNTEQQIKEARLNSGLPFLAHYDGQDYIMFDVTEIKDEDTGEWVIGYLYKLVNDSSRIFSRSKKVIDNKYTRINDDSREN